MSEKSRIETTDNPENYEFLSLVKLHFFRHDERKGAELTEAGRLHAKGLATSEDLSQSMAVGSNAGRTHITAGLRMAGASDEITGLETLDELKEKIRIMTGTKEGGDKITSDLRLAFPRFGNEPYATAQEELEKRGLESKTFLTSFADEDPTIAKEAGLEMGTYDKQASNIASIILKYVQIAPRFTELVKDDSKDYKDTMERYLGTHGSICEFFLMKLIDKTEGKERRNAFAESLENTGFGYSEGFEVDIKTITSNDTPEVEIVFIKNDTDGKEIFKFSKIVSQEVLEEIAEGK